MKLSTKRTFRFFLGHVKKHKALVVILMTSITAAVLSGLLVPYFYKRFFDLLTSAGPTEAVVSKLITILMIAVGINVVQWLFWRIANFGNIYFQSRIITDISNECFEYIHHHSANFFNNHFVGSLVKKTSRLARSFEGLADKLYYDLFTLSIKVMVIFGVLFWLHPLIGAIMMGWTFLFVFFNYSFSVYKLKYDVARSAADTRLSGALADTMTNNINIKLFAGLAAEIKRFKEVTNDWYKKNVLSWNLGQIAETIQTLLMIGLEFAVFYFAVKFWQKGLLTIGDFVWIQAYLLDLFGRLWDFGRVIRDVYERLADAEEMIEILHTKHEITDAKGAKAISVKRGKIEFKNVSFAYNRDQSVIRDLNLAIKPGEKVALIGPSGGGKSTVTKLLLRLVDVKKGKILIDGQDIKKVTQDSLHQQLSFVPQDPILFHRTLMENIRYGRNDASEKEVMAAARLAHCHDFIMKFPHQYQTYVGERGVKLSGGERQRVAIARAILTNAPILILDEATSSLDSESEMLIQEALAHLMKQKTTLIIAHRLSTIMKADRIIVLQDGEIAEEGSHADLISSKTGLYKKLWDLQVGGYVDN